MTRRLQIDAPPVAQSVPQGDSDPRLVADENARLNAAEEAPLAGMEGKHPSLGLGTAVNCDVQNHRAPSYLISFIVHLVILLMLAVLSIQARVGSPDSFRIEGTYEAEESGEMEPSLQMLVAGDAAPPADNSSAFDSPVNSNSGESFKLSDSLEVQLDRPRAGVTPTFIDEISQATSSMRSATLASIGVEGRSLEHRQETALARGGTLQSEKAVERALEWLAAHQMPNGSWSLVHSESQCNGRCSHDGANERDEPAATGLALLTFLGAGYTHKSGKYQEVVNKGIYYLLQIMEENGNTGNFLHRSSRGMYNHGIAAFALCEAYQMTADKDLRKPTQMVVNFIVQGQAYTGGWRYKPKEPGDMTITGWQMMALKSAHGAGLNVPPTTIVLVDDFLASVEMPNGIFYGYIKPERDATCSSVGQLLRMFRGRPHSDTRVLELAQFIEKQGRSGDNMYYNYYATLFMFHVGGRTWEQWNGKMRDYLVEKQSQNGHEAGSWFFDQEYSKVGGRLYTTCMCAMMLEIYYRYSPLYQQVEKPFEL
jgi:hypothetical protein